MGKRTKNGISVSKKDGIGFRGILPADKKYPELAQMQVLIESPIGNVFSFNIPATCLPYLPDMSGSSEFRKRGYWHWYKGTMEIYVSISHRQGKLEKKVTKIVWDGQEVFSGWGQNYKKKT